MASRQKITPTPARNREGICFGELSPAKYPTKTSPSRSMTEPARYGSNRLATKTLPSSLIQRPNMYTLVPLEVSTKFTKPSILTCLAQGAAINLFHYSNRLGQWCGDTRARSNGRVACPIMPTLGHARYTQDSRTRRLCARVSYPVA